MAGSRESGKDPRPNPVVSHGRVPGTGGTSPVRGAPEKTPRRRTGSSRGWPLPGRRRDRDPLPDGSATPPDRPRPRQGRPPGPSTTVEVSGPAGSGSDAARAGRQPWDEPEDGRTTYRPRTRPDDDLQVDPALDPALVPGLEAELDPALTPDIATALRGPEPGPLRAVRRKLGKALVPGERILVAQTRHPVVLAEPVLSSLLALLGIAALSPYLGPWTCCATS